MSEIQQLLRENVRNMQAYRSARDEFQGEATIYLDANENPFDWESSRYPDPKQFTLRTKIAKWRNVEREQVILGNGSDELIDLLIRAFCNPKEDAIRVLDPSYGMYNVSAELNDVSIRKTVLNEDFTLPPIDQYGPNEKLFLLCSPNNPTGNTFSEASIIQILESFPGIVVIDEAYADFSIQRSTISLLAKYSRLIILQTLSKAYASAGLRVGFGFGSREIINVLMKIKPPYNLSDIVQTKAIERLSKQTLIQSQIETIQLERERLSIELEKCNFIKKIYPSQSNFLLAKTKNANKLYSFLASKGIVVRNRSSQTNCYNCLRFSVGTKEENQLLIDAVNSIEND